MLIHQYDNKTGQYISSRLADADPRNLGRWLIPACCTCEALPQRTALTWPFFIDGAWKLLPDYRGRVLYRQDNREQAEILIAGVTPEESGLTDKPPPSPTHVWTNGQWLPDPAQVERKKRAAAMSEFEARMANARRKNAGKADAYAAGLLNDEEIYYFKAWATHQMDLVRAIEQDCFPDTVVWPNEPAAYVPPQEAEPDDPQSQAFDGSDAAAQEH